MNTEENTLQCDLCQKDFTCFSKLTLHKGTHNGEKQFQCSLCQKAFKSNGGLTTHKRTLTERNHSNDLYVKILLNQMKN